MKWTSLEKISSLAVVGATGLVGKEFLSILSEHKIKFPEMRLFASEKSLGESLSVCDRSYRVESIDNESFENIEVVFFSAPEAVTKKYVPLALKSGCFVVDDSSVYRMDKNVPLIVPQINGPILKDYMGSLMSIPNCSTTPLALCLKPLQDEYGLKRVVVSTYQSVSGAGQNAMDELSEQTVSLFNGKSVTSKVFPHRIAFNCLPQIGEIQESGNCHEEEKIIRELKKILHNDKLKVSATTVRVPTFSCHGVSANVELKEDFRSVDEIRELLDSFPGVKVLDQPKHHIYPNNVDSAGCDETFVGRIRRDHSEPNTLNFWVMTDNLREGAALIALQCLDTLYKYRRMA